MTLDFPHRQDVKLRKSPLTYVICEVRYSPILRIATELPVAFQEVIRHRFPQYEVEQSFQFQVPTPEGADKIPSFQLAPNSYRFLDVEGHYSVGLAQDAFSLSTDRYTTWEEFSDSLKLISEAAVEIYNPAPILRIGLRYINELKSESLGFSAFEDLLALLRPEITSPIMADVWTTPKRYVTQMELEDQDGTLAIRISIPPVDPGTSKSLVLDFDYYDDQISSLDDLLARCERFHNVIYDAFRWTILDECLQVFDPIP